MTLRRKVLTRAALLVGAAVAAFSVGAQGEPTPSTTEAQIAAMDTDRDGRLARQEARDRSDLLAAWAALDRNGDEVLETSEISGSGGGPLR